VQSIVGLTGRLPTSIPFASEASVFAGIADEIVVFGPGDMRTAHSERECVPLLELEQAYGVMCSLMSRA
jgi:acetylornithine deacetylase